MTVHIFHIVPVFLATFVVERGLREVSDFPYISYHTCFVGYICGRTRSQRGKFLCVYLDSISIGSGRVGAVRSWTCGVCRVSHMVAVVTSMRSLWS